MPKKALRDSARHHSAFLRPVGKGTATLSKAAKSLFRQCFQKGSPREIKRPLSVNAVFLLFFWYENVNLLMRSVSKPTLNMKTLLQTAPLVVLLATSCAKKQPTVATLPPVVKSKPAVSTKPKAKAKSNRTYRKSTASSSTKKKKSTGSTATTISKNEPVNPLIPDPVKVVPQPEEVPTFNVPENIQPKSTVNDGINQGLFIELKW